ncbi:dynein heavy chain and region D6 of dynein motor-domain-containing protein [Pavlovales sp. CCMP2436]|nr:dynein heavy chain and region D6 of dynein motor-domain-containing protein [Pavlovales sp. CCMP2436]
MAALDKYNTASNIALMLQHCTYGHVYDMAKLTQKVLLNTQYLTAMNPTAGSFIIDPRMQRLFATFAVGFPGAEALTTIYQTFLLGHLHNFHKDIEEAEMGKRVVQAALQLHRKVATTFRKTASNFHYEFNIRHMAGVFQGILMGGANTFKEPLQLAQLWLHESERVYGDRLVSREDLKKYKDLAAETAKKIFKEMSPTTLMAEPLIICHFAQGLGEKTYDRVQTFGDLSTTLTAALAEFNETNAAMNLVLFEDAIRHVCRISRIIESPGGHALLVGVGGSGKQSLSRLASHVAQFSVFQVVISATYGVNELKADLQTMYRKTGLKGEQMSFLFTDQQIADERFLVFLNDMLSSGDIPGLFPPEDQDDIVNVVRPNVKRAGLVDTRENCWNYFIAQVRQNLHAILCFSPVGDPIKVRTRRFPALVNCVVIDWFQPWPEDALFSVSKRFLDEVDLGTPAEKEAVIGFMPYSFVAVNDASREYIETERRYNWTTPKSFLELIALYKSMLANRRAETNGSIQRLSTGVTKLEKTASEVSILEEQLKIKQVEVEEKKIQCDAMIPKLDAEKSKAADEAAKANVIATAAGEKELAVAEFKAKIERDLESAEPALIKAAAALDSLNKKDLGELKSLATPPPGIPDVTGACVYLLHPGGKGKIDASWKASQMLMKDVNKFLDELMTFKDKVDANQIPKANFKNIRPLLEKEWFNVDTMRTKSSAAAGLCDWVLNIVVYWDINENVEPMREAAAAAVQQLEEAIASKDAALAAKEKAEATVAELTKAFNEAVAEKDAVIAEAEACIRKLGLAQRLMSALGAEGERWKASVAALKESLPILVGDALLAAAFVSYNGCFNRHFREQLIKQKFLPYLSGQIPVAKGGVPMGADADPLKILTNDAEIASWSNEGLPTDRISMENGTIATNCQRWPLMIDPQLQGITWIKRREEKRGLHIVRLGQKQLIPKLENALENGKPIIIENLATSIDAVLGPVISRQVTRRGRTVFVKLGDKEVDYHPDFKLYLQTKLSNPHYPPEIQAECTLINFMVTEDGLEDQLLALTVLKERPDLEEQKAVLISQMNGFKIKTKELEDGILEQLANAEGDILENIALIENLEDSKRVALEIGEKAKIAAVTEIEINAAREMYRRVAARGSLMFFLLATLNKVHTFYHFSLASFNAIVERAITGRRGKLVWNEEAVMSAMAPAKLKRALLDEAAERKKVVLADEPEVFEARMNFLVDNITFKVFDATRRGLLERHKLILATQLLLKVMAKAGELDSAESEYLTSGRSSMSPPQMTAKVQEFLTAKQWANACALKEVDAFKNLCEDLELGTDAWSEWLEFERPETENLPGEWEKRCTPFQKLLVLRALRTDRVTTSLTKFIENRLGARYTQQEPFDMEDTFNDSSYKQPLFFVLFPGVDPGVAIERLGRKLGFTAEGGNYVSIAMGQGQEKNAENTIDRFSKDGGWVFLQNIHLMSTWLPTLDRKLEIVGETGSEDFRAFLSAEPPPMMLESEMQTVPEGVLQASIKVANEPPTDLKATLRSSYALFDQATLDRSTKPKAHRPMLFTLAFFHSLVLGRRKFGFQGFSRNYPFNNGDITVCADVLHNYVEGRDSLPWADLKYIWGEIMYGGHITDGWDRRAMSAYLDVLLVDDLVDEKSAYHLAPGFRPLLEGDFSAYRFYIEEAMPAESPTLLGLHSNAEIALLVENCDALFRAVFTLQGGGAAGGGGSNKEARVKELLVEMQEGLPAEFAMLEIKSRVKEKTPYVVFVLQVRVLALELERANAVLDLMGTGMRELELGLSGALNVSDAMDALIGFLYVNIVPPNWLKICGQIGPTGNYNRKNLANWFVDLKERHVQLDAWSKDPYVRPHSVWAAGLFNPMGYVTACLQMTARAKELPLDSMMISTEVMDFYGEQCEGQPEEGTYVHGMYMEGARWSMETNSVFESEPKDLHPVMPVIKIKGVTEEELEAAQKSSGDVTYACPVYTTTIRGPTFTFAAPLRTEKPPWVWILAGVCLVMQPD